MALLSESGLRDYERDGVLFPVAALDAEQAERVRRTAELTSARLSAHERPVPEGAPEFKTSGGLHLNFGWAHALCTHPAILDVVEQILGPDILVHSSTLFLKPPGEHYVSWHQDGHYWALSEPALVSAWVALGPSTVDNGCLRIVPGSHRTRQPHTERRHPNNMLGTGSTVAAEFDPNEAVDVVLAPGQMSLHHVNALHGSKPNRSARNRTGYAIRYVAPHVRQVRGHPAVLLARGHDRFGHFQVQPDVPPHDLDEALARHIEYSEWLYAANLDAPPR